MTFHSVQTIDFATLKSMPFFRFRVMRDAISERPNWWDAPPVDEVPEEHQYIIPKINHTVAVEHQEGGKVLFHAACTIMRHGVIGVSAKALLKYVPAEPPFSEHELERALEYAYNDVVQKGEFNTEGTDEFPVFADAKGGDDFGFRPVPIDELEGMDLTLDWLVEGAFVGEGALFIGGREKSFKTGIAMDLLISLATKTPFLNRFEVRETRTSVIFTAEIGLARAKFLIKSIRLGRGLPPGAIRGIDVVDSVPSFQLNPRTNQPADPKGMMGLKRYFKKHRPQIAVFDPLYFAMGGASVGDMYEIGAVLRHVTEICNHFNVTPIFCHHARKDSSKEFQPMDLADLYGSGVSAFARQWILLAHAEPFRGGKANLYASIGGSSQGSRGVFTVAIDEGTPDDIMERTWLVEVKSMGETVANVTQEEVEEAIRFFGKAGINEIVTFTGKEKREIDRILRSMLKAGIATVKSHKWELLEGFS